MKVKRLLVLIILSLSILTGCSAFESQVMTQTNRPVLSNSPIKGVWEVEEVVDSKNRFSYKVGDEFYFDIDIFATPQEVFLTPEYEVQYVGQNDSFINDKSFKKIAIPEEGMHLVRLLRRGRSTINILLESEEQVVLIVNDQVLRLKRIEEDLTEEQKTQITESFSKQRQSGTSSGSPWAISLAIREYIPDSNSNRAKGDYRSYIISYDGDDYKVLAKDGILISEGTDVDHYEIVREYDNGLWQDNIYLNGEKREILNFTEERPQFFGVNYLSENYLSLEFFKPSDTPDTISVYSTRNIEGLIQLKSDDLIRFSSDKIYDRAINSQTDMRISNLVYNIGIYRENGLIILKGRIPITTENELINRDFAISGDFDIYQDKEYKYKLSHKLQDKFPDMVDFYTTGDENKIIVITVDKILVYDISKDSKIDITVDLKETSRVVSGSSFEGDSLGKLHRFIREN